MIKSDVVALLVQVKELVEAKIAEVNALPDEVPPSDDEEKAQLKAKVEELTAALASKDAELVSAKELLQKDEAKIEAAKADLSA